MRKFILMSLMTGLLLAISVGGVSAHRLEVNPPGQDEATVDQVVSTDWAQAHCNAEAPEQATANSDVIEFTPDEPLPCPDGPGEGAPGRNK